MAHLETEPTETTESLAEMRKRHWHELTALVETAKQDYTTDHEAAEKALRDDAADAVQERIDLVRRALRKSGRETLAIRGTPDGARKLAELEASRESGDREPVALVYIPVASDPQYANGSRQRAWALIDVSREVWG